MGRHQVRRGSPPGLMQEHNWRAIQPRSFVPRTTDSSHGLRACPNLLLALGQPVRPDQVWGGPPLISLNSVEAVRKSTTFAPGT